MGQQQLLLIVLGVIVVGIAVVVGINLFNANSVQANKDAVISDLNNLGALAQSHYKKPASMGGGNNTFNGSIGAGAVAWVIPAALDTTANGRYVLTTGAQSITIVGTGTETGVSATATITPTNIVMSAITPN